MVELQAGAADKFARRVDVDVALVRVDLAVGSTQDAEDHLAGVGEAHRDGQVGGRAGP